MLLKFFLYLDIIYLTWEYGLINSFSSWKMFSWWVYFSTMGADILDGAIAWNLKLFIFTGKAHKNISLKHWIVDFQIYKLYFHFFFNEKMLKSESFRSHDKLYLHIKICKQNLYGETPQLCNCRPASWFCKQWWGWGPGSLRARLKFYKNIFLIIMVKFQEKVC